MFKPRIFVTRIIPDDGLVEIKGMWLYTTRGVGVIGPPARFNCRPEITLQGMPGKLGSAVE
ncbi:MAG: hypothetical protein IMY80_07210 [Chloroflexi bacterium]|nr:hypothetical protein [Chloroflexota bacterium]